MLQNVRVPPTHIRVRRFMFVTEKKIINHYFLKQQNIDHIIYGYHYLKPHQLWLSLPETTVMSTTLHGFKSKAKSMTCSQYLCRLCEKSWFCLLFTSFFIYQRFLRWHPLYQWRFLFMLEDDRKPCFHFVERKLRCL